MNNQKIYLGKKKKTGEKEGGKKERKKGKKREGRQERKQMTNLFVVRIKRYLINNS